MKLCPVCNKNPREYFPSRPSGRMCRDCFNEQRKRYRKRKYTERDEHFLAKQKEYGKLYYEKHKERDRDKRNAYGRFIYWANIECERERSREYHKRKPEVARANVRLRRNRMLGAEGSHTENEWRRLKKEFNYMCQICLKSEPEIKLTEDHIIPLSRGGSDYISNIQPLCQLCNSKKGIK